MLTIIAVIYVDQRETSMEVACNVDIYATEGTFLLSLETFVTI